MADKEGGRKIAKAIVVSTTPDVCKTPGQMVPVPYSIVAHLSDAERQTPSVKMTACEVMTMDSRVTKVTGDEAGSGGGVASGVNTGYCKPITHSPTVRAEGHNVVRHSSEYWMNCSGPEGTGNTKGKVTYVEQAECTRLGPDGEIVGDTNPPVKPETKLELSFLEQLGGGIKGAYEGGADMVKGVGSLAGGAWNLTAGWATNPEAAQETWKNTNDTVAAIASDPWLVWDAIKEPYTSAWEQGEYGRAIGRGVFEVGTAVLGAKGLDKLAKTGKVAKAGTAVSKTGEVAEVGGEIGRVAKGLEAVDVAASAVEDGVKITGRVSPKAVARVEKFSEYIFKEGADHGKDVVFRNLGYGKDDAANLAKIFEKQAAEKFERGNFTMGKLDVHGQRIDIEIELPGVGDAKGTTSYMKSGWMIREDGSLTLNTPFSGFTR